MMSPPRAIKTKNAHKTADYYVNEESYYTPETKPYFSQWFGKGAEALGLSGSVEAAVLASLYEGSLPGGFQIKPGSNGERKAGYDLVFAMPKSASQVVLAGGDHRVYEKFVAAVKFTLGQIEADCAQSRRRVDGDIHYEKTGNLTVAMMTHFTSRSLDPHVHIHSNILNQTLGNDDRWGALSSDGESNTDYEKGFSKQLLANQKYYGAIFMAEFQKGVVDCGWQTETVGPNGMWEIADIPPSVRTLQSKRRNDIEKALSRYTEFSQKQADIITLATRPDKVAVEPDSLTAFWQDEIITEGGFDLPRVVKQKMADRGDTPAPLGDALMKGWVNVHKPPVQTARQPNPEMPQDIQDTPSKTPENTPNMDTANVPDAKDASSVPEPTTSAATEGDISEPIVPETGGQSSAPLLLPKPTQATHPSNTTPQLSPQRPTPGNGAARPQTKPIPIAVTAATTRGQVTAGSIKRATAAVDASVTTLSTFQQQFRFERLAQQSLGHTQGQFGLIEVKAVIEDKITTGELLGLDKVASTLTTRALLERESAILAQADILRKQSHSIAISKLSGFSGDIQRLLSPKTRLTIATVNKRLPLKSIQDLVQAGEQAGKHVRLLVPNRIEHHAVQGSLQRSSNSVGQWFANHFKPERVETVAGYLLEAEKRLQSPFRFLNQNKDCLLIDNTHRLSTVDLQRLLTLSEKNGSKLIFMQHGDKTANTSDALALLTKSGVSQVTLADTQTSLPALVQLIDKSTPFTLKTPANTLVITDSKKRQRTLSQQLRKDYQANGSLSAQDITVTALQPVFVTENTAEHHPYKAGQQVRIFGSGGGVLRIRRVNHANDTLTLYDERGILKTVKRGRLANTRHALYTHESLPIAKGEQLLATAQDKRLGLQKGATYTVTHASDQQLTVQSGDKTLHLSPDAWQGLPVQHDYVRNIASMGRERYDHVILECNAYVLNRHLMANVTELAKTRLSVRVDNIVSAEKAMVSSVNAGFVSELVVDAADKIAPMRHVLTQQNRDAMAKAILLTYQGRNITEKSIDHAIEVLSERQAGFTFTDIVTLASDQTKGQAGGSDVIGELSARQADGRLITGYLKNKTYLATPASLDRENQLVSLISADQGVFTPYAPDLNAIVALTPGYLTDSQKTAMQLILSNTDRFVGVQGFPGSGKSTLWKSVQEALKTLSPDTTILGLAPTHEAVKGLREKGINSQTLQSFIVDQQKAPTDLSNTLIVLDEVSQASNTTLLAFATLAQAGGARAGLQGDARQYQPIEQGKPWDVVLAKSSLNIAYNTEIVRQQTPQMQAAVKAAVVKDIEGAIRTLTALSPDNSHDSVPRQVPHVSQTLKTSVLEVKDLIADKKYADLVNLDKKGRIKYSSQNAIAVTATVDDYMSRTKATRDKTFVVVATRSDRTWVNNAIRQALQDEGSIEKTESDFKRLENTDLEKERLLVATHYKAGQVVRLEERYFRVGAVDKDNGIVTLNDAVNGDERQFMPEHYRFPIELYDVAKRSNSMLAKGDSIRLTKTFRDKQLFANQRWQVEAVNNTTAMLKSADGKRTHPLSTTSLDDAHWNYDHSVTGFSVQGADKRYAIGLDLAWHRMSVTWRKFLVELTRASHHFVVYTTHTEQLIKQLKTPANKVAAMEVNEDSALRYTLQKPVTRNVGNAAVIKGVKRQALMPTTSATVGANSPYPRPPLFPALDKHKMVAALAHCVQEVSRHFMGEPDRVTSTHYHYSRGIVVTISGKNIGTWEHEKKGGKGDMLALLQHVQGENETQAVETAARFLGGKAVVAHYAQKTPPKQTQPTAPTSQANAAAKATPNSVPTFEGEQHHHAKQSGLYYDGNAIETALAVQAEALALHLLGEPAKRTGETLRYGTGPQPSLEITITNRKGFAGRWKDWGQGKHGKMTDLIREQLGLDYYGALAWADRFLGGAPMVSPIVHASKMPAPKPITPQPKTYFHKYATRLIDKAVPLTNTLAQQYLQNRGVTVSGGKSLVFHPRVNTFIPDVSFLLARKNAPISREKKTYQFVYREDKGQWSLTGVAPNEKEGRDYPLLGNEETLIQTIANATTVASKGSALIYDSAAHSQALPSLKKTIETLTTLSTQSHRQILRKEGKTHFRPALLAIAHSKDDRDPIAQATYLDRETATKADLSLQKRTMGRLRDEKGQQRHVVLTPKPSGALTFIAEGVETAMSIKETLPKADVVVALGIEQFKNIDPDRLSPTVIIACDNDGKSIEQNVALQRAFAALIAEGKQVFALMPDLLQQMSKTDLNDILQAQGIEGVKQALLKAQPIVQTEPGVAPSVDIITQENQQVAHRLQNIERNQANSQNPGDDATLHKQQQSASRYLMSEYEKTQATIDAAHYDNEPNPTHELSIEKEI